MIFVDTGAWFARFVRTDPSHDRVADWFARNCEPLVTTDYCVDETLTLLAARKRYKLATEAGSLLFNESLASLHFITPAQVQRAWILFQQRASTGWALPTARAKL